MPKQYREYIKYNDRLNQQLAEGKITKERYEELKAMHEKKLNRVRENRHKRMTAENKEKMRAYTRDYIKKYRQNLREDKRCVFCGGKDEDTIKGHNLCHKCEVKRLGHEPRTPAGERKPPLGIPRKRWYLYGWCHRCRRPLSMQRARYLDRPMRVCDKCYEVILEIGHKRTLEAKDGDKWHTDT